MTDLLPFNEIDPEFPTYPELSAEERRVLKVVARIICCSQARIQWSYYDYMRGDDRRAKKLRERLMSKPVRAITS
jgi:hypothetical protein